MRVAWRTRQVLLSGAEPTIFDFGAGWWVPRTARAGHTGRAQRRGGGGGGVGGSWGGGCGALREENLTPGLESRGPQSSRPEAALSFPVPIQVGAYDGGWGVEGARATESEHSLANSAACFAGRVPRILRVDAGPSGTARLRAQSCGYEEFVGSLPSHVASRAFSTPIVAVGVECVWRGTDRVSLARKSLLPLSCLAPCCVLS